MSIECIRMMDMKLLVASSSVVHIGLCVSCVFYGSLISGTGVLIMLVAHGLCSSGLFYLCGVVYSNLGRRRIYVCKGLRSIIPRISIWWFLLCRSNMAAPPRINLLSEIIIICRLVR